MRLRPNQGRRAATTCLTFTTIAGLCLSLTGCLTPHRESIVDTPMMPPLSAPAINVNTQGSIYQAGTAVAFYENPRAQHIGDILTIVLSESYNDNSSTEAKATRDSSISADAADKSSAAAAKLAKLFNVGTASTSFNGKGSLTNTAGLNGTLAVTVIGTMPTGNLVVSGEKVISTSGNNVRLRLSGIVNPKDISSGNVVQSSKVANARIEQAGQGMLNDTTTLGWLQRMFLSVLTF